MTKAEAINKVLAVAKAEIGYLEKKSNAQLDSKTANAGSANYTKYWRDVKPAYQGQAWCACFVGWCLMQAFGQTAAQKLLKHWPYVYCPTLGSLFTKYANPQVGDIVIFYRSGRFSHTGIVTSVSGDKFTTIEGNTSGASGIVPNGGGVCAKSYYNSQLPGTKFCRPDWSIVADGSATSGTTSGTTTTSTGGTCEVKLKSFVKGNSDPQIKTIQRLLNALGYKGRDGKALTVDGDFGANTEYAAEQFQTATGIKVNNPGTVGEKTWTALVNAK